ncbi:hypothetical protein ScPMuIL_015753 [Solemya velum]
MGDKRDPLQYRGISLAPAIYKLYCRILNNRLTFWCDNNDILNDSQNGFRHGRSTIEHLHSLTTIIETRKLQQKSTYCAFVDFKKAYDRIDRNLLWEKLQFYGLDGNFLSALKVIYSNTRCCVRVNGICTESFDVTCGLKQGCLLSPLLFNLFINDLAVFFNGTGKCIDINGERFAILLYADDVVLLAKTPEDLNELLDSLSGWCNRNCLFVNPSKSKVVHFRNPSVTRTASSFKCGPEFLEVTDHYTYLGLLLTEHLNFSGMAKCVARSASRALGLVLAKSRTFGDLPYQTFTKLYDSLVWPVIGYGAAIWGTTSHPCIEAVQNRALRFFTGAAICQDLGLSLRLNCKHTVKSQLTNDGFESGQKSKNICVPEPLFVRMGKGVHMWNFGMGMFMIEISPESLQLTAIYGFSSGGAVLFFGALVGDWIDNTARLKAARMSLVIQNLCVIVCAIVVFVVLWHKDEIAAYLDDEKFLVLCSAVIILMAVGANLSNVAYEIAVERDWIVEICGRDKDMLASMTATLRRISLTSMILAPIAMGQIMTYVSIGIGAIFIAGWNVASVFIVYYLIWKVYQTVPALTMKQFKKKRGRGIEMDELEEDGRKMMIIRREGTKTDTKFTINSNSGTDPSGSQLIEATEELERTEKSKPGDVEERYACCKKIFSSFITLYRGWRLYIKYDVVFAGLGLASLYMTVLGFDNITAGFAINQGLSESIVGGLMGVGALTGIFGTVAYPIVRRRIGLERTGLFGLGCQISCLCLCVASVFAPGSPLDLLYWQHNVTNLSPHTQENVSNRCLNLTEMGNRTEATAYSQYNLTTHDYDSGSVMGSQDNTSYISIILLMTGVTGARFGLWIADLTIIQLFLEHVDSTERGIVNGVQNSLNKLMAMLKFVMVIIAPQPQVFGLLIIISFGFVVTGWALYARYCRKARGHFFHFEKVTQCLDFHNNTLLSPLEVTTPAVKKQTNELVNV